MKASHEKEAKQTQMAPQKVWKGRLHHQAAPGTEREASGDPEGENPTDDQRETEGKSPQAGGPISRKRAKNAGKWDAKMVCPGI